MLVAEKRIKAVEEEVVGDISWHHNTTFFITDSIPVSRHTMAIWADVTRKMLDKIRMLEAKVAEFESHD